MGILQSGGTDNSNTHTDRRPPGKSATSERNAPTHAPDGHGATEFHRCGGRIANDEREGLLKEHATHDAHSGKGVGSPLTYCVGPA